MKKFLFIEIVFFLSCYLCPVHLVGSFLNVADIYNEKFKVALVYNYTNSEISLQSVNPTEVLLDINGKQFKYFDKVYTQYLTKIFSNSIMLAMVINPFNKIKYELDIKVGTSNTALLYSRKLFSFTNSYGCGIGFGYTLFPQTVVTPGVSTNVKLMVHKYSFDVLSIDNTYFKVNTDVNVVDTSFSMVSTKMILQNIELDCGCEIVYRNSSMVDKNNYYTMSGNETLVKLLINTRIYLTKREKINLGTVLAVGKKEYNMFGGFMIGW